jgi:hypothetical protein
MTAFACALLVLGLFLAAWTALSVVSVPILALCMRSQLRANAGVTRRPQRQARASARRP